MASGQRLNFAEEKLCEFREAFDRGFLIRAKFNWKRRILLSLRINLNGNLGGFSTFKWRNAASFQSANSGHRSTSETAHSREKAPPAMKDRVARKRTETLRPAPEFKGN
jgi:hypothetical protein